MVSFLVGTGRGRQLGHKEVPGRDRWPSLDTERRMYMVSPLRVDIIGSNTGSATYQLNGLGLATHDL